MNTRRLGLIALVHVGLAWAWLPSAADAAPMPAPVDAAQVDRDSRGLGERLVAPCCWRETLGSHSSPLAAELRAEIRARLTAGEPPGAIEADLVGRYGPRVRALPRDWDPRLVFGGVAFIAAALALVLLVRWTGRHRPAAPVGTSAAHDDRLDDVLDDELAALDV